MSRAVLILSGYVPRERAMKWIMGAPEGTRVEFKEPKRTLPQNDRMWAMLTDVAAQKTHCGRRYSADEWKVIFLHALGRETRFVPSLDEKTFLPLGFSSSDLSKAEMSELMELIAAWGAERGVKFGDTEQAA
jgi:hypothetical protein